MNDWMEVKTQSDANALLKAFGHFHDSCIREAHLATGYWVSSNLHMTCPTGLDNKIRLLVQRQFKDPSAVELYFEKVTRFNLVPAPENCDAVILDATLLVQEEGIFWSVEGGWHPDSAQNRR